jgi:ribosomal protein S18 acetylase RimI-like enzyme
VENDLKYQSASESDIDCVFKFNIQIIGKYEDMESIDYDKVLSWVYRKLETRIHEYKRILINDELAGYYRFCPAKGKMELDDLYIFPEFQGQGIGTTIIDKCIKETELPIFLYVFIRNERAAALYKRLGFHVIETIKNSRYIMQREN